MVNSTSKPAAVLLLFLLHSSLADQVLLNSQLASQVLVRTRRANKLFEEIKLGNLERECVEEICDHEEAKEIFEQTTEKFWMKYLDCKGAQMIRTKENITIFRQCIEGQCILGTGVNYEGNIRITESGRECQYWRSNFPHAIIREYDASEPNSTLLENFCRNPDNRSEGPWCFTKVSPVQKETCRVPTCGEAFVPTTVDINSTCLPNYGINYTGDQAFSLGGHTCLQWSSPEVKAFSQDKEFIPEVDLQGNKCRNPDNDPEGPWCYVEVSGNVTVDYCNFELCEDDETLMMDTSVLSGQEESDCGQRPLFEKQNKQDAAEAELYTDRRFRGINNAQVASAPWQAMLSRRNPLEQLCAASLISDQWILTAAHCILYQPWNRNLTTTDILVRLGKHNRATYERNTEMIMAITEIIIHPKYNWRYNLNRDIALLKLKRPITLSNEIHPICLPSKEVAMMLISKNYKGRVTYWESLNPTRNPSVRQLPIPSTLQHIHLPIINQFMCTISGSSVKITDMFCAGYDQEYFPPGDTCKGNSGSPFVMKSTTENRWYQIGMASLGEGCDLNGKNGLYIQVYRMNKWMRKVINKTGRDNSQKQPSLPVLSVKQDDTN